MEVGVIFASSTCYTSMVADIIIKNISDNYPIFTPIKHNIAECGITEITDYKYAIYGIPTWDYGELQEDWEQCWDTLVHLKLHGQQAAIFGLGDQLGYPQWFQDAMGYLYYQLIACGANLAGHWPVHETQLFIPTSPNLKTAIPNISQRDNYHFEQSKALNADSSLFLGLALDEENQPELTPVRVNIWLQQVINHFLMTLDV